MAPRGRRCRATLAGLVHVPRTRQCGLDLLVPIGSPGADDSGDAALGTTLGEVAMSVPGSLAPLIERFFTQRLMTQRQVSPHTIASYRDTFRLFFQFARQRTKKAPSELAFSDVDVDLVEAISGDMENGRGICARSRNLRLSAIRSFFRYAAYYEPSHIARIQKILVIPAT